MREISCHCAHRGTAVFLFLAFGAALSLIACRNGVRAIDTAPKPLQADSTINGTVRGPAGTSLIDGRSVEAVNLSTGDRHRTTTSNAGGFTFKLKPGKYRVELLLRDGESLVKQPDVINLDRSDIDAHVDFVFGTARVARPRYHAPRTDDGLGSAIG